MTTLQTGTKVLIEATVHEVHSNKVHATTKNNWLITVNPSDLTVCETAEVDAKKQQVKVGDILKLVSDFGSDFTKGKDYPVLKVYEDEGRSVFVIKPDTKGMPEQSFYGSRIGSDFIIVNEDGAEPQPIDPNNFMVDITNPVNTELLPGFKEYVKRVYYAQNKKYVIDRDWTIYRFVEVRDGVIDLTNNEFMKLTTLPDLQKQHPGVFGKEPMSADWKNLLFDDTKPFQFFHDGSSNADSAWIAIKKGTSDEKPMKGYWINYWGGYINDRPHPDITIVSPFEAQLRLRKMHPELFECDSDKPEWKCAICYNTASEADRRGTLCSDCDKPKSINTEELLSNLDTALKNETKESFEKWYDDQKYDTHSLKAGQEYQWGKEYEFSADGVNWEKGLFISKNPRYDEDYLYMSLITDFILGSKYIRPIPAQPTVESELRQLYEKAKAIDRYETWKSLATAWHQKYSGRVEVSVPSDEEISDYYRQCLNNFPYNKQVYSVTATVRHFITRKEQQG